MARVGFLPAFHAWQQSAREEARAHLRRCTRCDPPHWPSFRIPDLKLRDEVGDLKAQGYEKLDTAPYDALVFVANDDTDWENHISGAKATIWVPTRACAHQHYMLVMNKVWKPISEANKRHTLEMLRRIHGMMEDPEALPPQVLSGNHAIFFLVFGK